MATIKVYGSEYTPGEAAIIYAQVLDDAGMPVETATVTVSLFKEDGSKYLDSLSMAYIAGSNGLYKTQPFAAPSEVQRMIADVKSEGPEVFGAEECVVTVAGESIEAIKGLGWTDETLKKIKELIATRTKMGFKI